MIGITKLEESREPITGSIITNLEESNEENIYTTRR